MLLAGLSAGDVCEVLAQFERVACRASAVSSHGYVRTSDGSLVRLTARQASLRRYHQLVLHQVRIVRVEPLHVALSEVLLAHGRSEAQFIAGQSRQIQVNLRVVRRHLLTLTGRLARKVRIRLAELALVAHKLVNKVHAAMSRRVHVRIASRDLNLFGTRALLLLTIITKVQLLLYEV